MTIDVKHILSVEVDAEKRQFIIAAHGPDPDMHVFGDVSVFSRPTDDHYCYSCSASHQLPASVDILAAGPSCKNISKMFSRRVDYSTCFLQFVYRTFWNIFVYAAIHEWYEYRVT